MLRKLLYEGITDSGFEAIEAKSCQEGLEIALREHPDLILLDILMKGMDGITMLKQLRENSWGKTVKVVVLTNLGDERSIADVVEMANEPFEYVIKADAKIDDIVERIKKSLEV